MLMALVTYCQITRCVCVSVCVCMCVHVCVCMPLLCVSSFASIIFCVTSWYVADAFHEAMSQQISDLV